MSSSNEDRAAAASAESIDTENKVENDVQKSSLPRRDSVAQPTDSVIPPDFDLNDFDDDFDDDFEAETAGEYELDDDEYARQLVEMVDFDIEGLDVDVEESDDDSDAVDSD